MIQWSAMTALQLHSDQKRSNGPYIDHIMRNVLRAMTHLNVADPEIISGIFMHDSIEDQAEQILDLYYVVSPKDEEVHAAALETLKTHSPLSNRIVDAIDHVSCPPVPKNDKPQKYFQFTEEVTIADPMAEVIRLTDFIDNAVNNHYTVGASRQRKLNMKYLAVYDLHMAALYRPDSLVAPEVRDTIFQQLEAGMDRAITRLSQNPDIVIEKIDDKVIFRFVSDTEPLTTHPIDLRYNNDALIRAG